MMIKLILVFVAVYNYIPVKCQRPVFSEAFAYFFTVYEGVPIGHCFGFVNATLSDSTKSISYEIFNIENDTITINNKTGELCVNTLLDADIPNLHEIKFSVSAYNDQNNKATTIVYVYIGDINDNFPVFNGIPYRANVTEDSPINTYVTRVQATDIDKKGLSELIYNIEGWTKDSKFSIKPFAGTIWTNKRLDYEANKKEILNISVTDGRPTDATRHKIFTSVELFVKDADDQGAKFDHYTYYACIEEGFHNMTELITVHASDLDKGINDVVSYSILPATNLNGNFLIDEKSGKIVVNGLIDREITGNIHYLTVQASSTTHSPATSNIIISINDTNDNGPIFEKPIYFGKVLENSLIGSKIIHVPATDADDGVNKMLEYIIKSEENKFSIDANGYVLVNGSLDREDKDIYTFEVQAIERYTKEKYHNSTKVVISIEDVNDNSPIFPVNFKEVFVQEEHPSGVFILQVTASDNDYGQNGLIEYSLVPDAENKYLAFYINPSNGSLFTAKKLDRETTAVYFLLIKAKDRAQVGQQRESLCTIKVTIVDINDNSPYFTKHEYIAEVTEAANVNTIVLTLTAFDKDENENAKLKYFILPNNQSDFFKIDENSGIIKTAKFLDREVTSLFNLNIEVKDGGNKSSSAHVVVNILDINDNSPMFSKPNGYKFNVTEEEANAYVGVVQAYDIDEGDSGKVNFIITDSELFQIDKVSGEITTKVALDRERSSSHRITVAAVDLSTNAPRRSFAMVETSVDDINDNAPIFIAPKQYSTVMRKDAINGTYVFTFRATDADADENANISFFIIDKYKEYFTLDSKTGVLRMKSPISSQINNSISIHVAAFDNGNIKLNDSAILHVFFANIIKNAPIIQPLFIRESIKENKPPGTFVYDVNAKYEGKADEKNFKYSIVYGGEEKFKIHFETGKVTTLVALDREMEAKYTLIIMVQLQLGSEANFATLEVTIEDENDNPPIFSQAFYAASVYENQKPKTFVAKAVVSDKDINPKAQTVFQIQGSNEFHIDENTGNIFTSAQLDREKDDIYNLTITAINSYSNISLIGKCEMIVYVRDLNDNAPLFTKSNYVASIAENAPVNTSIIKVNAKDDDIGINAEVLYDIDGNDCFFIERQSGVVRSSCILDRENIEFYQLKLIAKGTGNVSLSSTANLKIVVTDVDDNHPHFTSRVYRFSPAEDTRVGSIIGACNIIDKDSTMTNILYRIHKGNDQGFFNLDNITGVLTLSRNLDRETWSSYSLIVRVYNGSFEQQTSGRRKRSVGFLKPHFDEATIIIQVQDINDNYPIFTKTRFIAVVHKDAKFNSFVVQVYANDSDYGNNSALVYVINSGNGDNLFQIEKNTGKIKVYKSLVSDVDKIITMTVSANDNGGLVPTHNSINSAEVIIHVIGDNKIGIITTGSSANYLHKYISDLERLLSHATNAEVKIFDIKPTSHKTSFLVYFCGFDERNQLILTRLQLSKLILSAESTALKSSFKNWNISWYEDFTPTTLKSTAYKESSKEIYIGIIAAMAILIIIMAFISIWLSHKRRFCMAPVKEYMAISSTSRKSRQNITNESSFSLRDEPMRIADESYSFETIKSQRSANQYIIEPYESKESVVEVEVSEMPNEDMNSNPFYKVELHQETNDEIKQNEYIGFNAMPTPTWAYSGEDTSLQSDEDINEIIQQKLSNHSCSKPSDNATILQANTNEPVLNTNQAIGNVDGLILNTDGPIFTSERAVDVTNDESIVTYSYKESSFIQTSQTDDSNDKRKSGTEDDECNIDSSTNCLDLTIQSDITCITSSNDVSNNAMYVSNDSDHSQDNNHGRINESKAATIYSPNRCQSAPLKILDVQKNQDNTNFFSYL